MIGLDLRALASALDGEISGGQVLAPGPGDSRRDRSLSVRLRRTTSWSIRKAQRRDDFRRRKEMKNARE